MDPASKRSLGELEKPNLIILDALEYGKRLVADEEFVKIVEDRFEKVKRRFGLRWADGTWTWTAERGGGRSKN